MLKMVIHYRDERTLKAKCGYPLRVDDGPTTPNKEKVTCLKCQVSM